MQDLINKLCTCVVCILQVVNGHKSRDGFLHDYCDGRMHATHPLFSTKKGSLEIFLYYDDVEVCNPLGSRRTKHKLGIQIFVHAI